MLEYRKIGGIEGCYEIIKIFENGSVDFSGDQTKISDFQLQKLRGFIDNNEYVISKESLLEKWFDVEFFDAIYIAYLINVDNKSVEIEENRFISDIISQIYKEIRSNSPSCRRRLYS